MHWIYLSPHLDDAVLSAGGLIAEQSHSGDEAAIWTICAGDPPSDQLSSFAEQLHARWETGPKATAARRAEDLNACQVLKVTCRHFSIPDCIYRIGGSGGQPLYDSEQAIFGELNAFDLEETLPSLIKHLQGLLGAEPVETHLVCPLGLGGHVDHLLVRQAAEATGRPLWYYADFPYSLKVEGIPEDLTGKALEEHLFPISEISLQAWEEAVAAHASQISTFWPDLDSMRAALRSYERQIGGVRLWKAPI